MPADFKIQRLLGADVTPDENLSASDRTRLSVAKRTLDQNYGDVAGYIDGDLAEDPIFVCRDEDRKNRGFEVLRLLHNYLSSLYSFNEAVRVLVTAYTPEDLSLSAGCFLPGSWDDGLHYTRKLAFLRGLRTDFQHGGFSCLTFERVGAIGVLAGYRVVFERDAFVENSGIDGPERFLHGTNDSERRQPLSFVRGFQEETLRTFYADLEGWFDSH